MIWTECQNNQNHSGALVHPSSQGWLFNGSIKQKEQVIMRLSSMCFSKLTLKYRLFQHFPSPRKSHLDRYWPKTQAAYKGEWRVGALGEAGDDTSYSSMTFMEGNYRVISGPLSYITPRTPVTLRNTERKKTSTGSETNFSVRTMKGRCSPKCDQQNEIVKKGESAASASCTCACVCAFPQNADFTGLFSFGWSQTTCYF